MSSIISIFYLLCLFYWETIRAVDETGFCLSNPQEKKSSYIRADRSIINDEAGETCFSFSTITISTEFINRPGENDFVIGARSGAGYKHINKLIRDNYALYEYYHRYVEDKARKVGGQVSNAAIIYKKRVPLWILTLFYNGVNGQGKIFKKCDNRFMQANHSEAFAAIKRKLRDLRGQCTSGH